MLTALLLVSAVRAAAPPNTPLILEPGTDGAIVSPFDVHMVTDEFSDPDAGDPHASSDWEIWTVAPAERVWAALAATGTNAVHIHLGDGHYEGSHTGRTSLLPHTDYRLRVRHRDNTGLTSPYAERTFRTSEPIPPIPGVGSWHVRQDGYVVETVATGFHLPVNIAFSPIHGKQGPDHPYFYVMELYGNLKVVTNSGAVGTYATGLLNFDPAGGFPGDGERGSTGVVVDPETGDLFVTMVYDAGGPRYPKVERLHSNDGGRTMATRTVILDMPNEAMGPSHQISNITIGPDGKLYVHVGDGFDTSTAQDLDSFRGKILRLNKDGSAPADNPFYNAGDGISARDYVYAYGFRNPFGGAWRAADGNHYEVENGPGIDRFAQVVAGGNYLWDGSDASMRNFAIYVWEPARAPVNLAFVEPETYNGSGFPGEKQGHAYVSESGPTYASGPQAHGKRISEFVLDAAGNLVSGPAPLIEYNGTGRATVAALAAGPDGLYFSDLYRDDGVGGPLAPGAQVLRVRFAGVGANQAPVVNAGADQAVTLPSAASLSGTASDDGLPNPPGMLTTTWRKTSGPGTVSFGNASALSTSASFSTAGTYVLRLTASDGALTAFDELTVTVTSSGGTGMGLTGQYYNDVDDGVYFTTLALTRTDATVDFDWGTGSPAPNVASDNFSVRWTGQVQAPVTGNYTFATTSDDGVRLWVNNQLVIDNWTDHPPTTNTSAPVALTAGVRYDIRMEFYERRGEAVAQLLWSYPGQAQQVIPQSRLYSSSPGLNVKINFQPAASPVPAGYLPDGGAVFADRGNGYSYGWNVDISAHARDRDAANAPDQRYDTLNHMQKPLTPNATWEIALPNGTYIVRVVAGDPTNFDSAYSISVEGVVAVSGTPTSGTPWFEGTVTVTVVDGRLTIGNASAATNNKICFLEITSP